MQLNLLHVEASEQIMLPRSQALCGNRNHRNRLIDTDSSQRQNHKIDMTAMYMLLFLDVTEHQP